MVTTKKEKKRKRSSEFEAIETKVKWQRFIPAVLFSYFQPCMCWLWAYCSYMCASSYFQPSMCWLWANCSYTCASVIMKYNLVVANCSDVLPLTSRSYQFIFICNCTLNCKFGEILACGAKDMFPNFFGIWSQTHGKVSMSVVKSNGLWLSQLQADGSETRIGSCPSALIICPIAIAYSMGQIIKLVCISQCVCPSVGTLTVAFLDRFSPKLAQT